MYLDQEALREEYVLNDSGRIWMGSVKKQFGMPWNFGQVRPEWCSRKWACAIVCFGYRSLWRNVFSFS